VLVTSFGPFAVPLRRAVAGAPRAAPATMTAADFSPEERGLKVTLISQDLPAARVLPHSCLTVKSNGSLPDGSSGPRLKSALPVLLRVSFCAALEDNMACDPNDSDAGVSEIFATAAATDPDRLTAMLLSLVAIVRVAARVPAAEGLKFTASTQA